MKLVTVEYEYIDIKTLKPKHETLLLRCDSRAVARTEAKNWFAHNRASNGKTFKVLGTAEVIDGVTQTSAPQGKKLIKRRKKQEGPVQIQPRPFTTLHQYGVTVWWNNPRGGKIEHKVVVHADSARSATSKAVAELRDGGKLMSYRKPVPESRLHTQVRRLDN